MSKATTDKQSRSRYKKPAATRKRSLSQDSFAAYDDPQEEFLAKNKTKFDVPLSELDRLSPEEDDESMQRSGIPGSISRGTGKILAEDSSQSQSQSQSQKHPQTDDDSLADVYNGFHSKETKDVDMNATQNSESAYASSAPSSEYARFGEPPEESELIAPTTTHATVNTMLPTVDHDLIVPNDYVPPDDLEETQQSHPAPMTRRAFPPTRIPNTPPMPFRVQPVAPEPVRNVEQPSAQSKSTKKPPTKHRRDEEQEVVPDSMAVEEEEEEQVKETPLKALKPNKGKGKPAAVAPKVAIACLHVPSENHRSHLNSRSSNQSPKNQKRKPLLQSLAV